ncbi:iron transporter [Haloarchaeobius salinus]|uniref:iron transporter n=1 Tax=Haloarchaeobius salinus TaxID=1198298 RepID=UPI00210EDBC4|nr:iron transporter [Haloarchaeobius salinus]
MNRRTFLGATAGAASAGLAGCFGLLETQTAGQPPVLSDRPDAVYYPTHVEGMKMTDMATSGDYAAAVMYSYPHRFWTVTGDEASKHAIRDRDDAHVMVSIWDPETGTVVPDAGVSIAVTNDGETVTEEVIYPMLSQPMGFHYGANFALDGTANYTVGVGIGGLSGVETVGAFDGRFAESTTIDLELSYSEAGKQEIRYENTPDRAGDLAAVEPMSTMEMPLGIAPTADELPGQTVGTASSGDAQFVVQAVEADRFGSGTHLAVSPRTPYNGMLIPRLGLEASVDRDGRTVLDDALGAFLDPELGYHYGATVDGLESGDELTLRVTTPPQVARHEGYETAFLSFEPMTLSVA